MNDKEKLNFKYYKEKIENRKFTEYDIIGFLILIRAYISEKDYPILCDFANNIAHRNRNRGKVYDNILNSNKECYEKDENGNATIRKKDNDKPIFYEETVDKKVKGYDGIEYDEWFNECEKMAKEHEIKITKTIAKELLICIFSLLQKTKIEKYCKEKEENIQIDATLELNIGKNSIGLYTVDNSWENGERVCFMEIKNITIFEENIQEYGFINDAVQTFRKKNILYLATNKNILKSSKPRNSKLNQP